MEEVPDTLLTFLYCYRSSPRKQPSRAALKAYERSNKRMRHVAEMRQRLDISHKAYLTTDAICSIDR
jgi:hypothetical protein